MVIIMSELTRCNFCSLQLYKREAKETGATVHVVKRTAGLGGFDIYIVPKGEIPDLSINGHDESVRSPHWVSWMWQISDSCVC